MRTIRVESGYGTLNVYSTCECMRACVSVRMSDDCARTVLAPLSVAVKTNLRPQPDLAVRREQCDRVCVGVSHVVSLSDTYGCTVDLCTVHAHTPL